MSFRGQKRGQTTNLTPNIMHTMLVIFHQMMAAICLIAQHIGKTFGHFLERKAQIAVNILWLF